MAHFRPLTPRQPLYDPKRLLTSLGVQSWWCTFYRCGQLHTDTLYSTHLFPDLWQRPAVFAISKLSHGLHLRVSTSFHSLISVLTQNNISLTILDISFWQSNISLPGWSGLSFTYHRITALLAGLVILSKVASVVCPVQVLCRHEFFSLLWVNMKHSCSSRVFFTRLSKFPLRACFPGGFQMATDMTHDSSPLVCWCDGLHSLNFKC